jgi:hypothetical protein
MRGASRLVASRPFLFHTGPWPIQSNSKFQAINYEIQRSPSTQQLHYCEVKLNNNNNNNNVNNK